MKGLYAWEELMEKYFSSEDDQVQLEWAIGCVLSGGPQKALVITGPSGSGKTTVLKLIRSVIEGYTDKRLPIRINHDGPITNAAALEPAFVFSESNIPVARSEDCLVISTTGDKHPEAFHKALLTMVEENPEPIHDICVSVYQEINK